jgi:iduronate 2-sulfatase
MFALLSSFSLGSSDYCADPQPMPVGACFWPESGKPGALANSTLTTAADCCELCAANDDCAFWAARPAHKKCFLMQSGMQHMTEAGCQAGVKPPPPAPPTPAPVPTPPYPGNPRKNILLLAVDDLRPQFSCLDAPGTVRPDGGMHTPHVCKLAGESLVAMRSQVAMATCSPSRTAMLTGRHTSATHVWDLYSYFRNTTGNWTTLPQYFKDFHGYKTYGMGKIFHPGVASGALQKGETCPLCRGADDGTYSWSEPYFHGAGGGDPANLAWRAVPAAERAAAPLQDDQTLAHAITTLADVAKEPNQPFFVAVGFHKPHLPFVFPEEFLASYPAGSVQLPPNMFAPDGMPAIAWQSWGETRSYADITALGLSGAPNSSDGGMPAAKTLELRRAYYSAVSYTDDNIGQVLDALEQNGLANSTIVALWGDHGELKQRRCRARERVDAPSPHSSLRHC